MNNAAKKKSEDTKDEYGSTKALRDAINQKYDLIELIGEGSYGTVSKGLCKTTGKTVALKILVNQTTTEYDAIKVLRELQLMVRLNKLSS